MQIPLLVFGQITPFTVDLTAVNESCMGNGEIFVDINGTQSGAVFQFEFYQLPNLVTPVSVSSGIIASGTMLSITEDSLVAGDYQIMVTQVFGSESNSQTSMITVNNSIQPLPTFIGELPNDTIVSCEDIPVSAALSVNDNGVVFPFYSEAHLPGTCEGEFSLIRNWLYTNSCGNQISHTQILSVIDTIPPSFCNLGDLVRQYDFIIDDGFGSGSTNENFSFHYVNVYEPNTTYYRNIKSTITITNVSTETYYDVKYPFVFMYQHAGGALPTATLPGGTGYYGQFNPSTSRWEMPNVPGQDPATVGTSIKFDLPPGGGGLPHMIMPASEFGEYFSNTYAPDTTILPSTPLLTFDLGNVWSPGESRTFSFILRVENKENGAANGFMWSDKIFSRYCENASFPIDTIVNCGSIPYPDVFTATDGCSQNVGDSIEFTETILPGTIAGTYILSRDWYVEDNCGNATIYNQLITVFDTVAPIFNEVLPQDLTVNCDEVPSPINLTATDNCDTNVVMIFEEEIVEGLCGNMYSLLRTWTAIDGLGNSVVHTQTITVQDTIAPTFSSSLLQDTIYSNCVNGIPQPEVLTLNDVCGTPLLVVDELHININCWSDYTIKRDYYGVDECGNYSDTLTQYIIVIDTVAPVFDNLPLDDTLYFSCTDVIPAPETLTASGECVQDFARWNGNNTLMQNGLLFRIGDALAGYNSTISGYGTIVSNALVTDYLTGASPAQLAYFNGITFSITTDSLPGFTSQNANHGTGFNSYGYRLTNASYEITFSDDVMYAINGNPSLEYQEKSEFYGDFELLVPYDFNNGNWTGTTTFAAPSIVADLTAPTLSLQKIDDVASPINRMMAGGRGTFFGNSNTKFAQMFEAFLYVPDTLVRFETDTVVGACANEMTINRRWIAEDSCGNQSIYTQVLIVQDLEAPIFTELLPQDTTVNCDAIPTPVTLTATDNCSASVTVNFTETTALGSCANASVITRTWTVTDDCSNTTTHIQTINVQDTVAPIFVEALPQDTTVNCDAIPTPVTLTATDNCSASVTVNFTETTALGSCANASVITRTWTVTDDCSNTTTHIQTINVQDTVAPIFVEALPQDTTVNCDAIPTPVTLTATDNCSASVTVNFTETTAPGSCANASVITRTWTVTDDCSNTTTHIQTINVQDTIAPTFTASTLPNDTTVNCDAVPVATVTLAATDNCSMAADIVFGVSETSTQGAVGTCSASNYVITRTYTATDVCGNVQSHIQTITVQDTVAPVITDCPLDITQNNDVDMCGAIVSWGSPTATDNCTSIVTITSSHQPNTFFPVGTTAVTYTATDECGNESTCSFDVVITDVQKPHVSVVIAENFCSNEAVTWQQIVSDNCAIATVELTHQPTFDFPEGDTDVEITVTDIHGNDSTFTFTVTIVPMPVADIEESSVTTENTMCLGSKVTFSSVSTSSTNTYTWYHNGIVVGTGTSFTIDNVSNDDAGLYSLEVVSEYGCLSVDTFMLTTKACDITIFESFSPNGDGKNEFFYVENLDAFPNTRVIIYNRWGAEVFQSNDYQNDWDGRSQSKYNVGGDVLPEGTYFYLIELGGYPADETYGKIYKGYVYLKR